MSTKTLFIGLDGATFTILDKLTGSEPVMPFLGSIYQKGVRAKLISTPNPLTPPAWVSLMTGRTPGNHGIYDFIRAEERGKDVFFTLYDSRDCLAETIWSIAGRQGKKIAALNFPFTAPPPKDLNGIMVPGFIPWRHLRLNTHPRDFYDRLKKELPDFDPKQLAWDFELEKNAVNELTEQEREDWVRYHLPRERQWYNMAEHVLKNESPDLMAIMFDGVDKLQHQAWQFLTMVEKEDCASDHMIRMRALCLDYFRQLDGFIKGLCEMAGPDTQIFLASDHGFTATYEVVRINVYLEELGYLRWKEMPDTEEAARREDSMFANLDWEHTTAYCRTPSSNGITIRVKNSKEGSGISPDNYESFRNKLIADLQKLADLETGEPIIQKISRREDVFPGPAMGEAPDLLLVLRDYGFVSIKNKHPVVEKRSEVAGTHHPEGIFMGYGPGIKSGQLIEPKPIVDVAASLLYSLGLDIPENMEGKVPLDMFTPDHLRAHPPGRCEKNSQPVKMEVGSEIEEAEKDKLMDQLKMLGYME